MVMVWQCVYYVVGCRADKPIVRCPVLPPFDFVIVVLMIIKSSDQCFPLYLESSGFRVCMEGQSI